MANYQRKQMNSFDYFPDSRNEKKETPQQRTNNSIIVKLENEIDKYSLLPNVMNGLVTSGNMQKITEILFNLCNDKRKVLLETKLTKGYNEELTHRRSNTRSWRKKDSAASYSKYSYTDDARSADSRLSTCSKASTIRRKEILEDYLNFRDNLKVIFSALIDEVWKHCHITSNELSKNKFYDNKNKEHPLENIIK